MSKKLAQYFQNQGKWIRSGCTLCWEGWSTILQDLSLCWAFPGVLDKKQVYNSSTVGKFPTACGHCMLHVLPILPSLCRRSLQRSSYTLGHWLSWVCSSPSCTQLCQWRESWDLRAALKASIAAAGMPISKHPMTSLLDSLTWNAQ